MRWRAYLCIGAVTAGAVLVLWPGPVPIVNMIIALVVAVLVGVLAAEWDEAAERRRHEARRRGAPREMP